MKLSLTVCGVSELIKQIGKPWTHVVSIWDKSHEADPGCREIIQSVAPRAKVHFTFFNDKTDRLNSNSPKLGDVEGILNFTSEFSEEANVLVHCQAGVSRSPAIAYAIACQYSEPGMERSALDYIKSIRPLIVPNELVVEWADQLLDRKGQLVQQLGYDL